MSEQQPDQPLGSEAQLDIQWISLYLHGRPLHPIRLAPADDPTFEAGLANAQPIHAWIDELDIDFRDPMYGPFTRYIMHYAQEGYGQQNGLLADLFISAIKEMLICRGQLAQLQSGYQDGVVNLKADGVPAVSMPAKVLYLVDPGRPKGESYMCAEFFCEQQPPPGAAQGQRVLVTKLSHIVDGHESTIFFRSVVPRAGDAPVADRAALTTQLADRNSFGELRFDSCTTTMSVGVGKLPPPDNPEYAVL